MSKCGLDNGSYCEFFSDEVVKQPCVEGPCQAFKSAPTNADHIRAMSDEEMAENRVVKIEGLAPCPLWVAMDDIKQTQYLSKSTAVKVELDWLCQPGEEGARR